MENSELSRSSVANFFYRCYYDSKQNTNHIENTKNVDKYNMY